MIAPFTIGDLEELKNLQPPDWNDLAPQFRYYLNSPSFCHPHKISIDNQLAAIGTTIIQNDSAWLAHIVVHPEFRNQGLGGKITRFLVDSIDRKICKTISLIATSLGEPVYKKVGFIDEGEYLFLKDGIIDEKEINENIYPYIEKYFPEMAAIDREASGEDRAFRLKEFVKDSFVYLKDNKVEGFYLPTFGDGLIIAETEEAGIALMKSRLREKEIAVLPADNFVGINLLVKNNFKNFRSAKRMRIGEKRNWKPEKIFNRVSGQIG